MGLAPRVGLRVSVVADGAQPVDFPDADTVLGTDDAITVRSRLTSPFVVVATQGRRDVQGLKAALALQPEGLWFVASARKASVLFESLVASGEDAAAVSQIVAPAGEFIGAQTPEEIALSVLSSVVAARRGRNAAMPEICSPSESATTSAALPVSTAAKPVAAGGCCGGSKTAAMQAAATADVSQSQIHAAEVASVNTPALVPAAPVKRSCCGG